MEGYTRDGCRCSECTTAQTAKLAWYRRMIAYGRWPDQWVEPHRVTRRLQALACLGYSDAFMARDLDVDTAWVRRMLLGQCGDTARLVTLWKVSEMFDRLSGTPATGRWANNARRRAARNGWASPLAWDDIDSDVEPADFSHLERMVAA